MPRTATQVMPRTRRRAHAAYIDGWLDQTIVEHDDDPTLAAFAVAVADLYGERVICDPWHPVGLRPGELANEEVLAHLYGMLDDGRLTLFPGLLLWDRPWPLRHGPLTEGPDIVRLYVGCPPSE